MYYVYPTTLFSLTALLGPIAALTQEKFPIDIIQTRCASGTDLTGDIFDIAASVSDDLTFHIDVSTNSTSKKSYLAGFGEAATEGENYRECKIYITFHHPGEISELTFGDWDMKGTVTLSKGAVAKVTAKAGFGFQRNDIVSGHLFSLCAVVMAIDRN